MSISNREKKTDNKYYFNLGFKFGFHNSHKDSKNHRKVKYMYLVQIIKSKPEIPFYMAISIFKDSFDVISDASGTWGIGGYSQRGNTVYYWHISLQRLHSCFGAPKELSKDTGSSTIAFKELFAIAVNIYYTITITIKSTITKIRSII